MLGASQEQIREVYEQALSQDVQLSIYTEIAIST